MQAVLLRNWWVVLLRGICAIVFGLLAVLQPGITLGVLVLLFGIYAIVDGIFAIIAGVRAVERHERWGALIVEGILGLVAGAVMLVWPGPTLVFFVIFLGAWAIVTGIALLAAAIRLRRMHGEWLLVLNGIVSLLLGIVLFVAPIAGILVLAWWVGFYALLFGFLLVMLAIRLRRLHVESSSAGAPTFH
jgi:uncharacterized membrane protein HdeD (DUF308 family)